MLLNKSTLDFIYYRLVGQGEEVERKKHSRQCQRGRQNLHVQQGESTGRKKRGLTVSLRHSCGRNGGLTGHKPES